MRLFHPVTLKQGDAQHPGMGDDGRHGAVEAPGEGPEDTEKIRWYRPKTGKPCPKP